MMRRGSFVVWVISLVAATLALGVAQAQADTAAKLPVEVRGEGPIPMVLVPGMIQDWRLYEDFMARNAERYTMYAVTLPGFGGTAAPEVNPERRFCHFETAVARVSATIESLKLEKPVIVGYGTLGGFVALEVLCKSPEEFRAAVCVDTLAPALPLGRSGVIPNAERMQLADTMATVMDQFTDEQFREATQNFTEQAIDQEYAARLAEMAKQTPRAVAQKYLLELMAMDISPSLRDTREMRPPVLMIYPVGEEEGPASMQLMPRRSREVCRQIMDDVFEANAVLFARARELVIHDYPEEFDTMVADFLGGEEIFDFTPRR